LFRGPEEQALQIAESMVFSAQINCFVYIVSMAKISPITTVTNIRGTARVISLAITTKTIIKTITIR
jgi:hypothetical protein